MKSEKMKAVNFAGVRACDSASAKRCESFSSDSNNTLLDLHFHVTSLTVVIVDAFILYTSRLPFIAGRSALLGAVSANTLNVLRLPSSLIDCLCGLFADWFRPWFDIVNNDDAAMSSYGIKRRSLV